MPRPPNQLWAGGVAARGALLAGGGGVSAGGTTGLGAAADTGVLANSALTVGEILPAFFRSTLTCHIFVSPR